MDTRILDHYRQFSLFTNPGLYQAELEKLPDDIRELGLLIRKNIIHRTTLAAGNTGTNADLRFGDMTRVPWWRQPEDDVLGTVAAMLAELHRRNNRGLIPDRPAEDKLVLTCRFVSLLMASILKCKGIPARLRAGHADYFDMGNLGSITTDHWINQYWDEKQARWITIDVDGSLSLNKELDPYDMEPGTFDFPAKAWLDIRSEKVNPDRFYNPVPARGSITVVWALFYDFHCLMNHEIPYIYTTRYGRHDTFPKLSESELSELDALAVLMQDPDRNFEKLLDLWENKKEFRLLSGGLL